MLARVRVHGLLDSSVNRQIGLLVAFDVESRDMHATDDRCLED
jgi:hypothetical protein